MKPRKVFVFVLFFLALVVAPHLAAQEFLIEYSEGFLELRTSSGWEPIYIGSSIDRNATLRLHEGAYAELSDGNMTLRLADAGTFSLSDLVGGKSGQSERTIVNMIRSRLDLLTSPRARGEDTVGGVRGAEQTDAEGLQWVDGETTAELLQLGRDALAAGDLEQARTLFDDALLFAMSGEKPEAAFYLGYTNFLLGNMRDALTVLRSYPPDSRATYFHEYTMIRAQTELELSMAEDAVDTLHSYIASPERDPELLPVAHLLSGLGYRMAGNLPAAREQLRRVQAIAPDSSAASSAREILAEL